MENFSIVKFLQSMLTPPPSNESESKPTATNAEPSPERENPPETTSSEADLQGQRAVIRFMEEHERRAKRIQRK